MSFGGDRGSDNEGDKVDANKYLSGDIDDGKEKEEVYDRRPITFDKAQKKFQKFIKEFNDDHHSIKQKMDIYDQFRLKYSQRKGFPIHLSTGFHDCGTKLRKMLQKSRIEMEKHVEKAKKENDVKHKKDNKSTKNKHKNNKEMTAGKRNLDSKSLESKKKTRQDEYIILSEPAATYQDQMRTILIECTKSCFGGHNDHRQTDLSDPNLYPKAFAPHGVIKKHHFLEIYLDARQLFAGMYAPDRALLAIEAARRFFDYAFYLSNMYSICGIPKKIYLEYFGMPNILVEENKDEHEESHRNVMESEMEYLVVEFREVSSVKRPVVHVPETPSSPREETKQQESDDGEEEEEEEDYIDAQNEDADFDDEEEESSSKHKSKHKHHKKKVEENDDDDDDVIDLHDSQKTQPLSDDDDDNVPATQQTAVHENHEDDED